MVGAVVFEKEAVIINILQKIVFYLYFINTGYRIILISKHEKYPNYNPADNGAFQYLPN